MLDPEAVIDQSIPTVDPATLERAWNDQVSWSALHGREGSYSVESLTSILGRQPEDPIAIWARIMLLVTLLNQGALKGWVIGQGRLEKALFKTAANFPLPNGLEGADANEFVKTASEDERRL